jgi:hypothetical protein
MRYRQAVGLDPRNGGTRASATMPRRADVSAAMIAHGAKHPGLQIAKSRIVGKAAGVDLGVVVAVRIAAGDEHAGSPEASHTITARACRGAKGSGLSRACPIEAQSLSRALISGPVVSRGASRAAYVWVHPDEER